MGEQWVIRTSVTAGSPDDRIKMRKAKAIASSKSSASSDLGGFDCGNVVIG